MILGVIPARGGSKGVLRKNIKSIAGKPLIDWTIEAAQKSRLLTRFIVSTEDDEIADVACRKEAKVQQRPVELAQDDTTTIEVLRYVTSRIECDAVCLLQPTSPIRSEGLIDECIEEYMREKSDSLATGFYCKFVEYGYNTKQRQQINGFFYDDGNVYVINSALIKENERYGTKIVRKVISREENVEIDDEFDFWLAEKILNERKI